MKQVLLLLALLQADAPPASPSASTPASEGERATVEGVKGADMLLLTSVREIAERNNELASYESVKKKSTKLLIFSNQKSCLLEESAMEK